MLSFGTSGPRAEREDDRSKIRLSVMSHLYLSAPDAPDVIWHI